jgi:hypothetical protein
MKISDALLQAKQNLDIKAVNSSKLDSIILLSHAISFSKEQVIFNPDFNLSPEQQDFFLLWCKDAPGVNQFLILLVKENFSEKIFL